MLFIFDWDGTLSDSADRIVACMQDAAASLGLEERSGEDVRNIIGLAMREAILHLYPGLNEQRIVKFRDEYAQFYLQRDASPSRFFPGVMKTLDQLKSNGYLLAVATGKSRAGLNRIIESIGLTDFFHFSRCADETASKPDPLMLEELLNEAEVSVDQAVMIGDTEWDMQMANRAGMKKIAVDFGAHTRSRLAACKPEMIVSRFEDILEWRF